MPSLHDADRAFFANQPQDDAPLPTSSIIVFCDVNDGPAGVRWDGTDGRAHHNFWACTLCGSTFHSPVLETEAQAVAWLTRDGNLPVPCSRYGRDGEACAAYAWKSALEVAEAQGEPVDETGLEYAMGMVVNDCEELAYLLVEPALTGTPTVSKANAQALADAINAAVEAGVRVTVNGVEAYSRWGAPARAWGTGSLSVRTRARTTKGVNDVWFKEGVTLSVTLG